MRKRDSPPGASTLTQSREPTVLVPSRSCGAFRAENLLLRVLSFYCVSLLFISLSAPLDNTISNKKKQICRRRDERRSGVGGCGTYRRGGEVAVQLLHVDVREVIFKVVLAEDLLSRRVGGGVHLCSSAVAFFFSWRRQKKLPTEEEESKRKDECRGARSCRWLLRGLWKTLARECFLDIRELREEVESALDVHSRDFPNKFKILQLEPSNLKNQN